MKFLNGTTLAFNATKLVGEGTFYSMTIVRLNNSGLGLIVLLVHKYPCHGKSTGLDVYLATLEVPAWSVW